jgi:hypothetical protein
LSAVSLAKRATRRCTGGGAPNTVLRIGKDRLSYGDRGVPISKVFPRGAGRIGFARPQASGFYFAQGDEVAIEEWIVMPEFHKPGAVRDIHFKNCGHKLKESAAFFGVYLHRSVEMALTGSARARKASISSFVVML